MALERVAGPFTITDGAVTFTGLGASAWIQGLGLLCIGGSPATTPPPLGTFVVQMDGTAMLRSPFVGSGLFLIVDLRSEHGLDVFDGQHFFEFDYVAGTPYPTPWLTLPSFQSPPDLVCTDRFLRINPGAPSEIDTSTLTDGVTYIPEYTFSGTAPTGQVTVSRTNSPGIVCFAWSGGQIRFYDTINYVQVGPTQYLGDSFDGCWYIPKWDLFLELKSEKLKVYANEVAPAILSNPAPLSSVQAGLVTQIQVQLLGAQNEPCVGEIVNWSIASGVGSLTAQQSVTDANGNSQVGYICPVGASGSVNINAEVDF